MYLRISLAGAACTSASQWVNNCSDASCAIGGIHSKAWAKGLLVYHIDNIPSFFLDQ